MVSVNNTTNNKDLQQALQWILVELHISLPTPENDMKEQHNMKPAKTIIIQH